MALLRWGHAHGAAEVLIEAACSEGPQWRAVPEDVRFDLLDLADRMAVASGISGPSEDSGPRVLIEDPTGACVVLTVHRSLDHEWQAELPDATRADVEAALDSILSQFTCIWPVNDVQPTALWWPPECPVEAGATTLPVALWQVGRITDLGAPPMLSAGEYVEQTFVPLDSRALTARLGAANALGIPLLAPTSTGWALTAADGTKEELAGPLTVDRAADIVWGEEWQQWKRRRHLDELARLGWHLIDWRMTPANQPLQDMDVSQSRKLKDHFLQNGDHFMRTGVRRTAVLGGTPKSGKSATVRRMAAALGDHKKHPWQVLVLSGPTGALPDQLVAVAVGRHALGTAADRRDRQLLVFEDMRLSDYDNNIDVGELMEHVSRQLKVCVLTVLEYNENAPVEWRLGNVHVVTSSVNVRARQRFVDDLVLGDRSLIRGADRATAACATTSDLRRITQLLNGDEDPTARITARFDEMANDEREPLALAAALSLLGGEIDAQSLKLTEDDRLLFGVVPGRKAGSEWLSGIDDCLAVVDLYARAYSSDSRRVERTRSEIRCATIADLVEPELERELKWQSPSLPRLFVGARLFHRRVAEKLIARAEDELRGWAAGAPALRVAEMLGLSELLTPRMIQGLAEQLVARLPPDESLDWAPSQVLALVNVFQEVDSHIAAAVREKFVDWLVDAVDCLIHRRAGAPEERFALLTALERSNSERSSSERVKELLADRVLDVLHGLQIDQVGSYRLVRQVEEMQRRLERRTSKDLSIFPVDQEHAVQMLLNHEPDESDGVSVLIEAMSLRQQFEYADWEVRLEPYEQHLTAAMRFATAAEVARSLNHLHKSMPLFSTWLLTHWPDFPERARALLRKSAPTEAAMLINAVSRSSAAKVTNILWPNGVVDHNLVDAFAQRIISMEDASGAGQLLMAVNSASELFQAGQDSMASRELAEQIGEDKIRNMLRYDPRASTRYYLVKGVWDARASYCENLLDNALDVVVESVSRRRKHWGIELALRLGADGELGMTALRELRNRLTPDAIMHSMIDGHTTRTRALSHRLGRILHPSVPDLYLRQWDTEAFIEGLSTSSPASPLELCAEVAKTLTDAALPDAGRLIFDATGGTEKWVKRLTYGRRAEGFVSALTHLTALDKDGAREVVDKLQASASHVRLGTDNISSLAAWTRKAMLQDARTAAGVIRAIDAAKSGSGREVLDELPRDIHAGYIFRGELQQIQDPISQSRAARALVRAGMTRGAANSSWIESVYTARIQTVNYYASPRALTALLSMLSAWDSRWAATATKQINAGRIAARIRDGRILDLIPTIHLIRTLCALDERQTALGILEQFARKDFTPIAERLGLEALCQLVDVAEDLDPGIVPRVLRALRHAVDTAICRPVVLDERKVWRGIGRAQAALRRLSKLPTPVSEPRLRPNSAHAPEVAWAAVALDAAPPWGDNALNRMRAHLQRPWVLDAAAQGGLLLATARGWAPELRPEGKTWSVDSAPLWMLRLLYQEAASDPYLAVILRGAEPAIQDRLSSATTRADWDAHRLRLVLSTDMPTRSVAEVARKLQQPTPRTDNS
ncbi:hypothetical protein [Nocardia asiatica]|uniref:hypothetical protein n=1 Tax=Nocardia asiatica TaxID=209252 RepID=UPI00245767A7|nr:hypothetical protein [Nocardia asiatica]